ncbi:hypothetical protein LUZ62_043182 [Rhynchospora pubera]|uniref:Uncharacterized protein n=1 Tax=Rhynchospora pubera TaxID=906938 RepID=A0AAV8DAL7_9POAL|nr:hypothetical protein LUZ62_073643 [Rhynchospora pubera]KAJ4791936.1 hypothetical protein LUZ62_043182 [Rhynchospora pubera]
MPTGPEPPSEGVTALYQTPPPMNHGGEIVMKKSSKKGGMQKLIKSAFKRGETSSKDVPFSDSYGKPPTGQARGRRYKSTGSEDSASWDSDSTESFEESKNNAKVLAALRNAKIGSSYESFPWEKKMRELLPPSGSTSFLSILLLPKASDASASKYNSLEDTLARADTWLVSSQASGVPITFMSVQTEALLTKISGDTASATVTMGSLADLANMANVSLYGFEDYHGVDIGVVRAVRLWYTPIAGEMALEIKLLQGDTRLGFAISRTEEGFIYVSSVADENSHSVASTRSGLLQLYKEAKKASKLLIVSRVGNEKVLPWMVSTSGDIKCYDTVSLSQKLSLHRHALKPILLHFLMWDKIKINVMKDEANQHGVTKPPLPQSVIPLLTGAEQEEVPRGTSFEGSVRSSVSSEDDGPEIKKSSGPGENSFRFQNIKLPDSWV